MLQQRRRSAAVVTELTNRGLLPATWSDLAELDASADATVAALRDGREHSTSAAWRSWPARVDNRIRTDALEHLDEPDFPDARKVQIVRALHRMNILLHSYDRFLRFITPLVIEAADRFGRPARILELASGSGEFALALAGALKASGLPAHVTGSDYVPAHVAAAAGLARSREIPVDFRVINAFEMSDVEPDEYDIAFVAQSMHHFTPGQLARMIAQGSAVTTTAFVGVDGHRGLPLLMFLPIGAALTGRRDSIHDAVITARKFYSEPELHLIATLAAPGAEVRVTTSRPGMSVLTVRGGPGYP